MGEVTGHPLVCSVLGTMSESSTSESSPTQSDTPATAKSPDGAHRRERRSGLPFGPFGMLVVTAVSLAVAGLVAWGVVSATSSPKRSGEAIDIGEALDDLTYTPYVDSKGTLALGDRAPDLPLDVLGGTGTTLAAEVGDDPRPVLLNFWSSTCAPCLKEMPALESVHNDVGDQILFMGINAQDSVESAQEMIDRTGVTFPSARDPRGQISTLFAAHALPRTVLIGADGKILAAHSGAVTREKLIEILAEHDLPVP